MAKPLDDRFVAIGEISLSGEIRNVPNLGQRLNEAARLGIRNAVVAKGALRNVSTPNSMNVKECELVSEAVGTLLE